MDSGKNSLNQNIRKKKALWGFRSNKLWKKILSIIYLVFISLFALVFIFDGKQANITVYDFIIDKLFGIFIFLILYSPYIFLSNSKLRDAIPLLKKHKIMASVGGMSVIIVLLMTGLVVVNGFHSKEYLADMENHAYEKIDEIEATCNEDGKIEYVCDYCGQTKTETLLAVGHSYREVSHKESDETTEGEIVKECERCGKQKTTVIPKLKAEATDVPEEVTQEPTEDTHMHIYSEATCTSPKTCSVCEATEGKALGHKWREADCITPKACSVCEATEGEALGHSWKEATCETAKKCSECGKTEGSPMEHNWNNATCTSPKTCSSCGETSGSALEHNYVNGTCSNCGAITSSYNFSDSGMVWIPTNGGTKYHSNSGCSNMKDPIQVTKSEAVSQGFDACKRCH